MNKVSPRVARTLLLVCVVTMFAAPSITHASGTPPPLPGICSDSDRFGVAAMPFSPVSKYPVGQLHAGWYHNFRVHEDPPRPNGMVYVQTIRLSDDPGDEYRACSACPSWTVLGDMVADNPGSLWFIGNEPDRIEFQDDIYPTSYARLYHDFYTFLKAEDPTCLVGVAGVVQPTPIRFQYLDLILEYYDYQYGGLMPVDVWNAHIYILKEDPSEPNAGAGIPPGIVPVDPRTEWEVEDHDDLDIFQSLMKEMRRWMHRNGYADSPLVLSEFGILMPTLYGFDYPRVRTFMLGAFDFLSTATDFETGYPADSYRLVQAWAWYSLDADSFGGYDNAGFLVHPGTLATSALGRDYGDYASLLTDPLPDTVDLQLVGISASVPQPDGGGGFEVTLSVRVRNNGAVAADNVLVRIERDGYPPEDVTIPTTAPGASAAVEVVWSGLAMGEIIQATATVDPEGQHVECDLHNNSLVKPVLVGSYRLYLPLVRK